MGLLSFFRKPISNDEGDVKMSELSMSDVSNNETTDTEGSGMEEFTSFVATVAPTADLPADFGTQIQSLESDIKGLKSNIVAKLGQVKALLLGEEAKADADLTALKALQ
jgi:hypothetical protein